MPEMWRLKPLLSSYGKITSVNLSFFTCKLETTMTTPTKWLLEVKN